MNNLKIGELVGDVWADFIVTATHQSNPRPFTNREVMLLLTDCARRAYAMGVEDTRIGVQKLVSESAL